MNVVRKIVRLLPVCRGEKGMALLITIMTVALLAAVTLQYNKTTWDKYYASRNYMTGAQLTTIANSGVNIALAVLQSDAEAGAVDSFNDSWAVLDKEQFHELFPTGSLNIKVEDLTGRLPINNIVQRASVDGKGGVDASTAKENRNILTNLLLSGAFPMVEDETTSKSIVDAIVDWIDEDDKESDFGAESSYYRSLPKPYSCRNKPVTNIEELLLVKGVTPALLFGSDKSPGLAEFLTAYATDGKINLNTAPLLLIRSMAPMIDDKLLQSLDEYRRTKENQEHLGNVSWYKNIGGWPGDISINQNMLTTKSTFFQITSTGTLDTLSRKMVAHVARVSPTEVNLLVRKME
jgi:general secretion pathway protein K